jgi:hypothetical protein
MSIKPILFNGDMVRAILDGRKTVTRRVVKFEKFFNGDAEIVYPGKCGLGVGLFSEFDNMRVSKKPPYQPGDILYVRETWNLNPLNEYGNEPEKHIYKASYDGHAGEVGWHPSIHMPKEAARIWLKVTNVQVKRLRNITTEQAQSEGTEYACNEKCRSYPWCDSDVVLKGGCECFSKLWNTTIKKSDIGRYGWEANPWVWVIEFERCEKPEEGNHE